MALKERDHLMSELSRRLMDRRELRCEHRKHSTQRAMKFIWLETQRKKILEAPQRSSGGQFHRELREWGEIRPRADYLTPPV
jgi:hypothetical protein